MRHELSKYSFVFAILTLLFLGACSPVKNVQDDEYLLNRVKVKVDSRKIDTDELYTIVKQKPNRRILWFVRFHLGVYNLYGKESDSKIKNTVGEPPVIYDSILTKSTESQLIIALKNNGYYESNVNTEVKLKRKRARVKYNIEAGVPHHLNRINYLITDPSIAHIVEKDTANSLLEEGKVFEIDRLENERKRITRKLKNEGYYFFSKEHIYYEADTSKEKRKVDLFLGVKNNVQPSQTKKDSVLTSFHRKYKINEVYVTISPIGSDKSLVDMDTVVYKNVHFIQQIDALYKPKALEQVIFINPGDYFLIKNQELTYRRLSGLRNFKQITINYEKIEGATSALLNCYISLVPVVDRSFSIETNGTNSGGNLGVQGNLGFQHLNTFRGAEIFNLKLSGGLEVQQLSIENETERVIQQFPFNTVEFGPDVSLKFPKFLLPFGREKFSKNSNSNTSILAAYNFQQRPDYRRNLSNVSLAYSWYESKTKQHIVQPIDISYIKLNKSERFQNLLDSTNNSLLLNSYTDHFIIAGKYSFILNTQQLNRQDNFIFFRANGEVAGNLLNLYNRYTGTAETGDDGSFKALNIRYAQYIRTDFEFKYYIVRDNSSLVFRTIAGLGRPYGNLDVLPFEKSFFAGGSNDIRAWRARDLGPASLSKELTQNDNIDQIGDVKLEGNIEYRFDLTRIFQGALFTDMGNIWLLEEDDKRPNGEIAGNKLWTDLAIAAGVGLRLDFNFFLLRFDLAGRIKDPSKANPDKLRVDGLDSAILNFGIGYPF